MNSQVRFNKQKEERAFKQQTRASKNTTCHHCGAVVPSDVELCPDCKRPIHNDHCTFCGSKIFSDDKFCPECGNPTKGMKCPKCGTMNFRGFCYKCHEPITENAQIQLAQAQADPLFQRAQELAAQIAKMVDQLTEEVSNQHQETMSDENRELINSYKSLLQDLDCGKFDLKDMPQFQQRIIEKKQESTIDLSYHIKEIKQKVTNLTEILRRFEPDQQTTPQVQRDYYSARKVKITTKHTELLTTGWKCNFCGYVHNNPEECNKPDLGGEWRYREMEVKDINWIKE
jgi:rubrerythrin